MSFYDLIKDTPIMSRPRTALAAQIRKQLAAGLALSGRRARSVRTGKTGTITRTEIFADSGVFELENDAGVERLTMADLEFLDLPVPDEPPAPSQPAELPDTPEPPK